MVQLRVGPYYIHWLLKAFHLVLRFAQVSKNVLELSRAKGETYNMNVILKNQTIFTDY